MIPVTVKFPVSEAEWIALCAIQEHQAKSDPFAMITQAINTGLARGFAANDFNDFDWADDEVMPELTAKEQQLLDERLMATHEDGQTSILDAFTVEGVGSLKPNFTEQIIEYYTQNPGKTIKQGAVDLGAKFINHFYSEADAEHRLYSLIHVLCSSKKQKRLTKVQAGAEVGVFVSHQ